MKTTRDIETRWMIRRDMLAVLDIEADSFEFPWTAGDLTCCLRQRHVIAKVVTIDERVAGFMIYESNKKRLHLLNIAVSRIFRRMGVATRMIEALVAKLSAKRRSRIVLEVRESNLAAQLFFRENGFRGVAVLREYYKETPEDAFVMERRHGACVHATI